MRGSRRIPRRSGCSTILAEQPINQRVKGEYLGSICKGSLGVNHKCPPVANAGGRKRRNAGERRLVSRDRGHHRSCFGRWWGLAYYSLRGGAGKRYSRHRSTGDFCSIGVPGEGIEPSWGKLRGILSPAGPSLFHVRQVPSPLVCLPICLPTPVSSYSILLHSVHLPIDLTIGKISNHARFRSGWKGF